MSMECRYCGYDNEPLPGDDVPESCEGCGVTLGEALNPGDTYDPRDYL